MAMKKFLFVVLGIGILSAAYASVPANTGDEAGIGEDADSTAIVQTVRDFFLSESIIPDVFPTIDQLTRMDMLDYYDNGKKEKMPTRLGGEAYIDSLSDNYLKVVTSQSAYTEIAQYTRHGKPMFAIIRTILLPAADSRIRFVDPTESGDLQLLEMPSTEDFLTKDGKKKKEELLKSVDFSLVRLSFLPDGNIKATTTLPGYLSKEDSAAIAPYLTDSIVYRWTGSKFKKK